MSLYPLRGLCSLSSTDARPTLTPTGSSRAAPPLPWLQQAMPLPALAHARVEPRHLPVRAARCASPPPPPASQPSLEPSSPVGHRPRHREVHFLPILFLIFRRRYSLADEISN